MDFRGEPGLKTGMKNDIFWSKIGSAFEEPDGTPPPRIPEIPPLPPPPPRAKAQGTEELQRLSTLIFQLI